jgi:hypothetical protein
MEQHPAGHAARQGALLGGARQAAGCAVRQGVLLGGGVLLAELGLDRTCDGRDGGDQDDAHDHELEVVLDSGDAAEEYEIIQKGGAPDNCDGYSINGGKIFRLQGVDKWFLAYQAGVTQGDFPQRFHLAISDDLIHWTKLQNPQPLFTRGPRGSWDQGAIWAPSCFEYKDRIYMYYEGWGHVGAVENRDKLYFLPGHSEIGIASCSKKEFLEWCGLQ